MRAGSIRPLKTGRAAGGLRENPAAYEGIFFFHEKNIPSRSPGRTAGRDGAVASFASPGAGFDAFPPALPRLPPSPLERRRGRERLRPPQRRMRPAKRGGSGQNSGSNRPQRMVDAPPPAGAEKPRASPAGSCGPSLGIRPGGWAGAAAGERGDPDRRAASLPGMTEGKGTPAILRTARKRRDSRRSNPGFADR